MKKLEIKRLKLILTWLPVLLCMLGIFLLSAQTGTASENTSRGVIRFAVETAAAIIRIDLTEAEKLRVIENINSARGYMHAVEFFILGLMVQNAVFRSGGRGRGALAASLAICVVYGISDEVHQIFVPGRVFQLEDIAMDAAGSALGILAVWSLHRLRRGK